MPLTAGAIFTGISALGKAGLGFSQLAHSKKVLKRPVMKVEDEYFDNRSIGQNMAQHGLTEKALDFATSGLDRGLMAGIDATLAGGGSLNNIEGLFDRYKQGTNELAVRDATDQNKNIAYFVDRNKELAGKKTQAWVVNKLKPFEDEAKGLADERKAGYQNLFSAGSELGAGFSAYSNSKNYEDMLKGANKSNPVADYFTSLSKTDPYSTGSSSSTATPPPTQHQSSDDTPPVGFRAEDLPEYVNGEWVWPKPKI